MANSVHSFSESAQNDGYSGYNTEHSFTPQLKCKLRRRTYDQCLPMALHKCRHPLYDILLHCTSTSSSGVRVAVLLPLVVMYGDSKVLARCTEILSRIGPDESCSLKEFSVFKRLCSGSRVWWMKRCFFVVTQIRQSPCPEQNSWSMFPSQCYPSCSDPVGCSVYPKNDCKMIQSSRVAGSPRDRVVRQWLWLPTLRKGCRAFRAGWCERQLFHSPVIRPGTCDPGDLTLFVASVQILQ